MARPLLWSIALPSTSWAQSPAMQITVNSPADGPAQANSALTLREAIKIVNGTLALSALSPEEQQLVVAKQTGSTIQFDLPAGKTTIELNSVLPAITQPNVTIDGTTQLGYDASHSATAEIAVPVPVVVLRPADDAEVFRGLTLSADRITVRGLSLYGFNASSEITHSTPPADIFITHRPASLNREMSLPFAGDYPSEPPENIVIEQNWLGLPPDEAMPAQPSGFGVFVFDSTGTVIRQNRIEKHNGSGIITGRQADNLEVLENIIVGNGLAGMPDAIRLDGKVNNARISDNLLCGNDGSGVFLFKPDGAVTIINNDIRFNGQRLRRAAVYLMGDNHRVLDNNITHQKGEGVTVTAFGQGPNTQSSGNVITGNRFDHIEGLSIDLNVRRDRTAQAFQRGDGPNPQRNSHYRRQDTGNGAVNAPVFVNSEFLIINGQAAIQGQADPNSEIQLYRSTGVAGEYGPLTEPVAVAIADRAGAFEFWLDGLSGGEVLSAIATDSRYGTSEPALNTTIRSLSNPVAPPTPSIVNMSQCTTRPLPLSLTSSLPPTPPLPSATQQIQLEVPHAIHYGLNEDFINSDSTVILDRIAAVMQQYPTIILDLYGYAESRASMAYNQGLGRRHAENARRYLLHSGGAPERMTLRSLGETQLRVEETDWLNYGLNRRGSLSLAISERWRLPS